MPRTAAAETRQNELPAINADPSWTLPMPGHYVIGTDNITAYTWANSDYTKRRDPSEILPVLDRQRTREAA